MRPRGPSSSFPSSRYVGHVALQKPQCTQVRRMRSASAACSRELAKSENWVCMASELGLHATGVEYVIGDHPRLEAAEQSQHGGRQRVEGLLDVSGRETGGMAPHRFGQCTNLLCRRITAQPALRASPIDQLFAGQTERRRPHGNRQSPEGSGIIASIEEGELLLAQVGPPRAGHLLAPNTFTR